MNQKTNTTDTLTDESAPKPARPGTVVAALTVVAVASAVIFHRLGDEPHFADESAMIAQSYYYTLFKTGRWDHPDWLHYAAYDHPPLPKYLFGLALDLAGKPVPQSIDWWMNWSGWERVGGRWVESARGGDFRPPQDAEVLVWARVPAALFGVAGALALFFVGLQVGGRLIGLAAAFMLLANPLYLTHARRAMSDAFAECLVIASVALALWGWKELWQPRVRWSRWAAFLVGECLFCGLAALAKLNGGIAAVIVLAVLGIGWLLSLCRRWSAGAVPGDTEPRPGGWNLLAGLVVLPLIGGGSFLVFLGLNPFLTARPSGAPDAPEFMVKRAIMLAKQRPIARARYLVEFRRGWSQEALTNTAFQRDWLRTPEDRLRMAMWEGYGRFSVLGPRDIRTHEPRPEHERFSEYRRATSLGWLPLCLAGFLCALRDGWCACRAGRPPQAWVLVVYTAAVVAIVVLLSPLNWDRYYLPIQGSSAVLAPYAVAAMLQHVWSRLVLMPNQALNG